MKIQVTAIFIDKNFPSQSILWYVTKAILPHHVLICAGITFLASESMPAIFTHTSFRLLSHLLKEKVLFDIALVPEVKRPSLQFKLLTPDSDIELFISTAKRFAEKIYQELGHLFIF